MRECFGGGDFEWNFVWSVWVGETTRRITRLDGHAVQCCEKRCDTYDSFLDR